MAPVTRLAEAIRGDDDRWCLLIVIGLALTFTVMHYNFIETPAQTVQGIKNVTLVTRAQIDLAQGKMRQSAHLQQRILVPNIFYVISFVSPWPPVTFLLAEGICFLVSLIALFVLSRKILGHAVDALLAVLGMSVFIPIAFSLAGRVGEALLFGIYSAIALSVITNHPTLFLLGTAVGSLQRPDVAICGALFGIAYDLRVRAQRGAGRYLLHALVLAVPVVVFLAIRRLYDLDHVAVYRTYAPVAWKWNLTYLRFVLLMFAPLVTALVIFGVRFDRVVWLMLLSLTPYLIGVTFLGGYSESRLLLPLLSVLAIGVIQSMRRSAVLGVRRET